jgi:hypothetical protein
LLVEPFLVWRIKLFFGKIGKMFHFFRKTFSQTWKNALCTQFISALPHCEKGGRKGCKNIQCFVVKHFAICGMQLSCKGISWVYIQQVQDIF